MQQVTKLKQIALALLVITGFILPVSFAVGQTAPRSAQEAAALAATNLTSSQNTDGSIGDADTSAWAAMALIAAGQSNDKLNEYIMNSAKNTNKNSATDLERTILALTAAGKNPYDVTGRNLVADLKALANNGQIGSATALNDDIFGMLALRAAGQDLTSEPAKSSIDFIKRNQLANGGFNDHVGATDADIDITAAAIQALNGSADTSAARNFLIATQNSDGGFPSRAGGQSNSASTSWVMWALGNVSTTTGKTSLDFLISKQVTDGSFGSILITSYTLQALAGRGLPVGTVAAPTEATPSPAAAPQPAPAPEPAPTPAPAPVQPVAQQSHIEEQKPVATEQAAPQPVSIAQETPPAAPVVKTPKKPIKTARQKKSQKTSQQPKPQPVSSNGIDQPLPSVTGPQGQTFLLTSALNPPATIAQNAPDKPVFVMPNLGYQANPRGGIPNFYEITALVIGALNTVALILLWRRLPPPQTIQTSTT